MLTMIQMTYVIMRGKYTVEFWNIIVGAEMRRVQMIIPTENKFISHVKSDRDDSSKGLCWGILENYGKDRRE